MNRDLTEGRIDMTPTMTDKRIDRSGWRTNTKISGAILMEKETESIISFQDISKH